jgi:hypothetical protein
MDVSSRCFTLSCPKHVMSQPEQTLKQRIDELALAIIGASFGSLEPVLAP